MTVSMNKKAVDAVLHDPALTAELLADGWLVADVAADLAPKLTGRGAKTIRAEVARGTPEPEIHVSWTTDAWYLALREFGTENEPARPFLRAAADRFR